MRPITRRPTAAFLVMAMSAATACSSAAPTPGAVPPGGATAAPGAATVVPGAGPTLAATDFADNELAGYCDVLARSDNPFWGRKQMLRLQDELEALTDAGAAADPARVTRVHADLAQELLRLGEAERAAEHLDTARQRALGGVQMTEAWARSAWWLSAITYLRLADRRNCTFAESAQTGCTLPMGGPGAYADAADARKAIDLLEQFIALDPDVRLTRAAVWLLNVAHDLAGTYPEGVPEGLRLDLAKFDDDSTLRPMRNIAPALGVDAFDLAGGAVIDDLDNDGLLDLVASTMDQCDQIKLYHNNGDGTFENRAVAAGIAGQPGVLNLVQTDFDNDGWIDLFLTRGAWLFTDGRQRRSLLRNNGDGTFTDVAREAGLAEPAYPTQAAAWGDYDNDGDLDVFIGNEEASVDEPFPSQLFRNSGDGTFTDVAGEAGVLNERMAKGSAWGDFDNDGDQDLYVSNFGPNRLYVNQGDGTFVDQAPALGVVEPSGRGFATWFWDFDNDGWLDIFAANHTPDIDVVASDYLGQGEDRTWSRVYRNLEGRRFDDVTARMGLNRTLMPMGANYGDVDGDGFPDFYLGTGAPGFEVLVPNFLFHNVGGKRFADATRATGTGFMHKGHGVAFGDLDNDGDLDLYHQLGGMYPSDRARNALLENPGHGNHWLAVELRGTRSNRIAIGARLKLTVTDAAGTRDVHAMVGAHGSFGGSSLRQTIGIGAAQSVDVLEVWWPATGLRQTFRDVAADQHIRVTEGADAFEPLERPRLTLGP